MDQLESRVFFTPKRSRYGHSASQAAFSAAGVRRLTSSTIAPSETAAPADKTQKSRLSYSSSSHRRQVDDSALETLKAEFETAQNDLRSVEAVLRLTKDQARQHRIQTSADHKDFLRASEDLHQRILKLGEQAKELENRLETLEMAQAATDSKNDLRDQRLDRLEKVLTEEFGIAFHEE